MHLIRAAAGSWRSTSSGSSSRPQPAYSSAKTLGRLGQVERRTTNQFSIRRTLKPTPSATPAKVTRITSPVAIANFIAAHLGKKRGLAPFSPIESLQVANHWWSIRPAGAELGRPGRSDDRIYGVPWSVAATVQREAKWGYPRLGLGADVLPKWRSVRPDQQWTSATAGEHVQGGAEAIAHPGWLSFAAPSMAQGLGTPDEETGWLEHRVKQNLAKPTPCRLPDSLVRAPTPAMPCPT
jgi:hypothetical protein